MFHLGCAEARTWLPCGFLSIVGLLIALASAAAFGSTGDQDACRIGAVSPGEYRAIAAEVTALPVLDWQEIHGAPLGLSDDLEDRVATALRGRVQVAIAPREGSD
jgi:hypothetical protein